MIHAPLTFHNKQINVGDDNIMKECDKNLIHVSWYSIEITKEKPKFTDRFAIMKEAEV